MNDMIVKVVGNPDVQIDEFEQQNPGGIGANGSGDSAFSKL